MGTTPACRNSYQAIHPNKALRRAGTGLSVGLHASDDWEILACWIGLRAFVSYKPLSPPKKINRQLLIPSLSENPLLLIPTPGDPSRYQAGGGMDHF